MVHPCIVNIPAFSSNALFDLVTSILYRWTTNLMRRDCPSRDISIFRGVWMHAYIQDLPAEGSKSGAEGALYTRIYFIFWISTRIISNSRCVLLKLEVPSSNRPKETEKLKISYWIIIYNGFHFHASKLRLNDGKISIKANSDLVSSWLRKKQKVHERWKYCFSIYTDLLISICIECEILLLKNIPIFSLILF